MGKIGKIANYIAAFILFFFTYGAASFAANVVIDFLNTDLGGWAREYVLPYFISAFAGAIGVVAGFTVIEKLSPTIQLRLIAWAFTIFIGIIWLLALVLPFINGDYFDAGITVMAVQSVAALIAAFKLSAKN